jgi:hypothetical protein
MILAIDPGPEFSAYAVLDNFRRIHAKGKVESDNLAEMLREKCFKPFVDVVVIEKIASYGMPVGAEVFETCVWSGRFMEAALPLPVERITRHEVKLALCHSARANDATIRQALIDRYGGPSAIGRKANPGPLYGVSGDVWAAIAVGHTYMDKFGLTVAA